MSESLILVVDDEASVREALHDVLQDAGYRVALAASGEEAVQKMNTLFPDAMLLDIRMPGMSGIQVLEMVRKKGAQTPIILMTAFGNTETTITAMRLGAFDYILKPIRIDELLTTMEKATRIGEPVIELRGADEAGPGRLIGNSRAMQSVCKAIGRIVDSNVTVLIQGESGTGKELVAEAIHYNSPRREKAFVKINCASIPVNLLESELFGHEKGAFTGAAARKRGKFELAHEGTIFLDEIGEIAPSTQAKLLRVLQEKAFERVGGIETQRVDVRIIAATNKNLEQSLRDGSFREDLFYRLNVVEIVVPPLRERKEDIPLLADHFVSLCGTEFGKQVTGFSRHALDVLQRYDWPGNVRELKNVCERAVLMAKGSIITADDLPPAIRQGRAVEDGQADQGGGGKGGTVAPLKDIVAEVERSAILNALRRFNGNRSAAAQALRLNRSSLYAKMKELGIAKV